MPNPVSRHFVTVRGRWGTRQVHYRRAGSGPLLLMLHQSPQSSRELAPLMAEWAERCTVVAPDSPGYGLSDPLGVAQAGLDDFAAATVEFLDAIGARRCGVYGFHTGGMIGVALAHHFPQRVTAAVCNGIAILTDAERREILAAYLPPFEPRWDGGHLAWLWGRIREQTIFFPWHDHRPAARLDFPMPAPDLQQAAVLEFLRAADHYHVAYRAAFTYRGERVAAELTVPTLLTAAALDPLAAHLARIEARADCVQVVPSVDSTAALGRARAHLERHPGDAGPGPPDLRMAEGAVDEVAAGAVAGRLWSRLVDTSRGPLRIRSGGPRAGQPLLLLHGAGGSAATLEDIAGAFARTRPVLAMDLPGHGESDFAAADEPSPIARCRLAVMAVLDHLGLDHVDVLGVEGGAVIAMDLAGRLPARAGRIVLADPPLMTGEQRTVLRAGLDASGTDWYGGHLLRAWHTVRDGRLYFPWCRRDRAGIRWTAPDLDDRRIQLEVTELLKAAGAWQALATEQLNYPLAARLASPGIGQARPLICAGRSSPYHETSAAAASAAGLAFLALPADRTLWADSLAPHLG